MAMEMESAGGESTLKHVHADLEKYAHKMLKKLDRIEHKEHQMVASNTDYVSSGGAGGFGGGFGGIGGIGLFGLVGLLGANGLGGRNDNGCDKSDLLTAEIATLQAITASTTASAAGLASVKDYLGGQIGELAEGLCNMRYENAQQTYQITTAIAASAQSINEQAQARAYADLERQLAVAQNGGPRVQSGNWVTPNPCPRDGGNDVVNQTIVQIGSRLSAIEGALRGVK